MSVLLHQPTPAHAAQPPVFEPSESFKAQLRRRIDDNLDQLLLDAKRTYEEKLLAVSSSASSSRVPPSQQQRRGQQTLLEDKGAADLQRRRQLYCDYLQTVEELKAFARDEYNHAIERERQEMEWCLEAEASVAQAHQEQGLRMVALEEGFYGDQGGYIHGQETQEEEQERFRVDQTLKEEQFEMLEAFHEEMKRAEAKARAIEHPSSDDEDGYYHASDESSSEDDYENVQTPMAGPSGYYRRDVLVELSEIEEESEREDDEEEDVSEPGTPIVQPLDAQLKAHAEELSRLLSATPSPPPSPCLTAGSSLPSSPFTLLSQPELGSVDHGLSPISSPSPPDTPPSLSASASASDCELDGTDTAPSSVASSIIFDPRSSKECHDVVAYSSASGNGMIFTPPRSVIDEEIRVRAERHAKQQEAFARKAEEIRRKKVEDKKMERMNEMLVSLVKVSGDDKSTTDKGRKEEKAVALRPSTPPKVNNQLVQAAKGKVVTTTPFNSPAASRARVAATPSSRYAAAPTTPSRFRTTTPSLAVVKAATPAPKPAAGSSALFSGPTAGQKAIPRTFVPRTGFSISPEDMLRIFIQHDQQWARLSSAQASSMTVLKWADFPWPVLSFSPPKSLGELSKDGVAAYVYSSFDVSSSSDDFNGLGDPASIGSSQRGGPMEKQRERQKLEAMRERWSGYGFERMLFRVGVSGGERERVKQGASMVCGWLREIGEDMGASGAGW